jgi:DNA-binding MarR family transcriptional regulator
MKKTHNITASSRTEGTAEAPIPEILRPGLEIRTLRNMTNRYLAATLPQEAETATGGNTAILIFLNKHRDDEIFQYDIEKRFGIARSTASRVLGLMEKKGLIERRAVERDARLRRIVLTEKAIPITQALKRSATQMEQVMLRGLSAQDQEKLLACFTQMRENLIATGKLGSYYDDALDFWKPRDTEKDTNEEEGKSE